MFPDRHLNRLSRRPCGFSIVSAIFLLVILSLLGTLMLTFSTVQHTTAAQDVQGSRAYQAARAGIEWGLYQLLQTGAQAAPGCSGSTTLPVLGGTLSGFTVTVTCTAAAGGPYNESSPPATNVYTITATANSGGAVGNPGYVERRLAVTAER